MAPLPSNERVKALAWINDRIVAFVVGTGGASNSPWTEQWFYFNDPDGPTYGDYPEMLPAAGPVSGPSSGNEPQGGLSLSSSGPVVFQYRPIHGSDIGSYHGVQPSGDQPAKFYNQGLKDLLDHFGRTNLTGSIGYVYGETRKNAGSPANQPDWIEADDCTAGGTPSPKAVVFMKNSAVVGYAYSATRLDVNNNHHKRMVHQFLKPGASLNGAEMDTHTTTAQNATAFFTSILSNLGNPAHVDYLYGCANVWKDCNPDINDKPQDPAQYPGS